MSRTAGTDGRREIRARSDDDGTIVVYQAYNRAIADAATAAGTFVAPFRRGRMTWIKPSFLWMAYRSGWARKEDQERVLAVHITMDGLRWALAHACLSSFDIGVHATKEDWQRQLHDAPVRVQWDPERDLQLRPLDHRAIQIGLRDEAVDRYLDEWIVGVDDATGLTHEIAALVAAGELDEARRRLPDERPVPVDHDLRTRLGMVGHPER